MVDIVLVNASHVLTDAEISATISTFQKWDDDMLRPAWGFDVCKYSFMTWSEFEQNQDENIWPIFINNHSTDPGVGGFHDDEAGRIFGRVFAGDALRYGISWTVDASHEAAEIRGNPTIDKTVNIRGGMIALRELCDPVEADEQAIDVDGVKLSNFVLPSYFDNGPGPWDYQNKLTGPCPTLTVGGYQSLYVYGAWTQITASYIGGPQSYRSQRARRIKIATKR